MKTKALAMLPKWVVWLIFIIVMCGLIVMIALSFFGHLIPGVCEWKTQEEISAAIGEARRGFYGSIYSYISLGDCVEYFEGETGKYYIKFKNKEEKKEYELGDNVDFHIPTSEKYPGGKVPAGTHPVRISSYYIEFL